VYSSGIERALEVAGRAHAGQFRKNADGVPYLVHPVHVALMLTKLGLDEVTVQAGILHDVVEDSADWDLERIEREFGAEVRSVVAELTEDKSRTWAERKQAGIDHVAHMSERALHVKAADKLHNLASLVRSLEEAEDPAAVWACFKGGRERTLAMSREFVAALTARVNGPLKAALESTVEALARH
jgi:(p)ppGpp synthase/HD superfamily hydrolase